MTVTHRKRQNLPDEISAVAEPGLQIECDSCLCDLTHSIRIKCADPLCEAGDGVDICPACFCAGKEFSVHKRWHDYRVVELHSYPIFAEDWGADEELLLLEGVSLQGIGNWQAIAEHVGTRTKEEIEAHYNSIYVDSPDWPLPRMGVKFDIDPSDFQARKRRRIATINATVPPPLKAAPTSAPGVHEISTFLPGRLEFEHELDNEAEDLVKDLEFGICLEYGGDQIVEDENDLDVKGRAKWIEERKAGGIGFALSGKVVNAGLEHMNGGSRLANGRSSSVSTEVKAETPQLKSEDVVMENGTGIDTEESVAADEVTQPPPIESLESLTFKLTLMEMYAQRVEKRRESKAFMFNRGLLEYKKTQAAEKKRAKEEKDIIHRLRPFARLQTAADFEAFSTDIVYEAMLRKRIQELQHYRRMGLTTVADIEKYDLDLAKRLQAKSNASTREYHSSERHPRPHGINRQSSATVRAGSVTSFGGDSDIIMKGEREETPKLTIPPVGLSPRKPPAPLNLANSPSLHLLTPAEQTLCSQLRILPKPYLVIKETLVREYARRGGKLRRREARDLVKIDVNKTSRVWDFLVQAGFLRITQEPVAPATSGGDSGTPSPSKDPTLRPTMSATSSINGAIPMQLSTSTSSTISFPHTA